MQCDLSTCVYHSFVNEASCGRCHREDYDKCPYYQAKLFRHHEVKRLRDKNAALNAARRKRSVFNAEKV